MPNLHEIILALRSPETYPIRDMIRYALYKDRLNRLTTRATLSAPPVKPGRMISYTPVPQGGSIAFENMQLEVIFLAPDLVRLSWSLSSAQKPPLPYAIAKTDWPAHETSVIFTPHKSTLASSGLELSVYPDGMITYAHQDGNPMRVEEPPECNGQIWTSLAQLRKEEAVFGLGEHTGGLNLRGQSHRLWNTDPGGKYGLSTDPIYMPIPVYIGSYDQGSYLVFYENYHRGAVKVDPDRSQDQSHITFQFEGGMLRQYFIPGPLPHALERYTELTGRAPLPPRWSLGYHQSRWGYRDEKDVREVLGGFREHELPLSAIHFDIDYMDGYRVFTINRERFPAFAALVQELDDAGVKTVTIIDPGVKKDPEFDVYADGVRRGVFCRLPDGNLFNGLVWPGWTVYPDFTNPETRDWWGSYYQRHLDVGVAGIWHDMNEPCSFSAWGGLNLPDLVQHHLEGQGGDHVAAHNVYALQMNRAAFEAMERNNPERRPWLVSRSGWAGQQRYAWNWTGDTESTWEGLKLTISTVLNLGLSGFPYSGPDIGGFSGAPSAELYLRWFQLATFLPFFRTHSAVGTPSREPWVYGEPYCQIIRKFLLLRYKLMPYWYTLAWEVTQSGHPMVRPRFWYAENGFPAHHPPQQIDSSFFLGSSFFISPITEPGSHPRQVILPEGYWYDFWDDARIEGGTTIEIPSRLDQIPVYVKAGNLIPMEESATLQLHIYCLQPEGFPGDRAQYSNTLYSDAGDGDGPWRLDCFRIEQNTDQISIGWVSQGEFPFPYQRVEINLHGARAVEALVDNQEAVLLDETIITGKFSHARIDVNNT